MRSPKTPLRSAIESYARHHAARHSKLTQRTYGGAFTRFCAFVGDASIADLNATHVNRYVASCGTHRFMARGDTAALKSLAKWMVKAGILQADPLAAVITPKVPRSRARPLDDRLIPQLLKVASETTMGARDRAIVALALSTGARPNELRQLRYPEDIDLDYGLIRIREETSKTPAGHREVPIDPQVIALIDDYLKDYRPHQPGPLFLNAHGDPLTYYGFAAIFYRLRDTLRELGLPGFTAYRMRHTGITNMARTPGYTAFDIQVLAGHESMETTRKYVQRRSIAELRRLPSPLTTVYGRIS
ncbi:MAG TPA: tyrosine-type recombinase/integrase [Candidatus Limnocylindria bacterium]